MERDKIQRPNEEKKRIRRSINWGEQEKKILKMLVLKRASIIENKDGSSNTNMQKKAAWEEIASCFNKINFQKRDVMQLQNQWRNLKHKARKSDFEFRPERTMTVGGSPAPSPPQANHELIDAILQEFPDGSNDFDNDTINEQTEDRLLLVSKPAKLLKVLPQFISDISDPVVTQCSPTRKRPEKNNLKTTCCSNHEHEIFILMKTAREEAIQREREAHEVKVQHDNELHKKRMAILTLEEEYWNKMISQLD